MECSMGAELTVQALIDHGVDYVFSLSGGHITPIYQFLENSPIKIFDTRHEQAAVFMADAYARLTRRPGVALVTAGPGFTNALTPISHARTLNTPLVLISGRVGIDCCEKMDLQDIPQVPVIAPLVKATFVCEKAERVYEFVDMAFRAATSGRPGPVYLEIPVDVLNCKLAAAAPIRRPRTTVESRPVDLDKAAAIVDMLKAAKKPIIIAGSGAYYSDAGAELTDFVEKTGVPIFTSAMGRGVVPDTHPLCFEGSLAIRPGASMMANMSADLVILLGTRITLWYIFGDIFSKEAKMVQVDIEPEEIGRNHAIDLPVVSDIKALVKELLRLVAKDGLADSLKASFAPWVGSLEQADANGKAMAKSLWESPNTPIHPMRLAREVDAFMNREDDMIVADGGDTTTWLGMTKTMRAPGTYLDYGLYGCIGAGLPNTNAVKLLYPDRRVCLLTGDGSLGFNFMEFEVALRRKLPIVCVISNDLGWGMIRHSQEIRLGHAVETGTFIGRVDYHKMVEALGGKGFLVEKPEDIRPALEAAFACGLPACVNVMTDPTTVSPGSMALANLGAYKA